MLVRVTIDAQARFQTGVNQRDFDNVLLVLLHELP